METKPNKNKDNEKMKHNTKHKKQEHNKNITGKQNQMTCGNDKEPITQNLGISKV